MISNNRLYINDSNLSPNEIQIGTFVVQYHKDGISIYDLSRKLLCSLNSSETLILAEFLKAHRKENPIEDVIICSNAAEEKTVNNIFIPQEKKKYTLQEDFTFLFYPFSTVLGSKKYGLENTDIRNGIIKNGEYTYTNKTKIIDFDQKIWTDGDYRNVSLLDWFLVTDDVINYKFSELITNPIDLMKFGNNIKMIIREYANHINRCRMFIPADAVIKINKIKYPENKGGLSRFVKNAEERLNNEYDIEEEKEQHSIFNAAKILNPLFDDYILENGTKVIPIEYTIKKGTEIKINKLLYKTKAINKKIKLSEITLYNNDILILQDDLQKMKI